MLTLLPAVFDGLPPRKRAASSENDEEMLLLVVSVLRMEPGVSRDRRRWANRTAGDDGDEALSRLSADAASSAAAGLIFGIFVTRENDDDMGPTGDSTRPKWEEEERERERERK